MRALTPPPFLSRHIEGRRRYLLLAGFHGLYAIYAATLILPLRHYRRQRRLRHYCRLLA